MKANNVNRKLGTLVGIGVSFFAIIGISIHGSPCFSQPASGAVNSLIPNLTASRRMLKNTDNPEFKSDRLKQALNLPDLPAYPGKTEFVTGTIFSAVKGGASATMQFSVSDAPDKVRDWYKQALAENQWKSLDNVAGKHGLAAIKNKNICQIMTMPPSHKGYKCDLLVRYKFYKPTDFTN